MYIGYMGDIVFVVSPNYMLTPMDHERESTGRWTEHDLLMRKPVSQFGGPGLEKLTFSIILDAAHNIDVAKQLEKLRKMRDTGAVFPLIIGGKPVSQCYWRLDSIKEAGHYWTADGRLLQCTPSLTLTEYDDSNYVEEKSIVNKYGKAYNTAGSVLGGL